MVNVSKRDIQNVVENARNRIMERMLTRQDMMTLTDNSRDRTIGSIGDIVQSCHQQMYNRENVLHGQTQKYIMSLESRIISMEAELKGVNKLLIQILKKMETQRTATVTLQPEQPAAGDSPYTKYVYQSE